MKNTEGRHYKSLSNDEYKVIIDGVVTGINGAKLQLHNRDRKTIIRVYNTIKEFELRDNKTLTDKDAKDIAEKNAGYGASVDSVQKAFIIWKDYRHSPKTSALRSSHREAHIEELLDVAEAMTHHLRVPYISEAFEWYKAIRIDCVLGWRLPGLEETYWGEVIPPPVIEGFTLSESQQALVPFLRQHLDDPQLCDDLEVANEQALMYCSDLFSPLQLMIYEACNETGLGLMNPAQGNIACLTKDFFKWALIFANGDPERSIKSKIRVNTHETDGKLSALSVGVPSPIIIAWAPSDLHDTVIEVFDRTIGRAAWAISNSDLRADFNNVESTLETLRRRLSPIEISKKVVAGKCSKCPPKTRYPLMDN